MLLCMGQGLTQVSDLFHTIPHVMLCAARLMMTIRECDLPPDALLRRHDRDNGHVDCFQVEAPGRIELGHYVEAFYTTSLFKAERTILSLAGHPSTDAEASMLVGGQSTRFAAWTVEGRDEDQLLMRDTTGRTRSWFHVSRTTTENPERTMLYFGSGVTAVSTGKSGSMSLGPAFRILMPVHMFYSRALLAATLRKIALSGSKVTA